MLDNPNILHLISPRAQHPHHVLAHLPKGSAAAAFSQQEKAIEIYMAPLERSWYVRELPRPCTIAARDMHVLPELWSAVECRSHGSSTLPSISSKSSSATSLSSTGQAATTQEVDVTHKVTLKAIPKKVMGNEENVWGEMWVLQGSTIPTLYVLFPFAPSTSPLPHCTVHALIHLCLTPFLSAVGQILRVF